MLVLLLYLLINNHGIHVGLQDASSALLQMEAAERPPELPESQQGSWGTGTVSLGMKMLYTQEIVIKTING